MTFETFNTYLHYSYPSFILGCFLTSSLFFWVADSAPQDKLAPSPDFHSCTIPANSQWVQENCYVEEHDDFNKWNCKDGSMLLIMKGLIK